MRLVAQGVFTSTVGTRYRADQKGSREERAHKCHERPTRQIAPVPEDGGDAEHQPDEHGQGEDLGPALELSPGAGPRPLRAEFQVPHADPDDGGRETDCEHRQRPCPDATAERTPGRPPAHADHDAVDGCQRMCVAVRKVEAEEHCIAHAEQDQRDRRRRPDLPPHEPRVARPQREQRDGRGQQDAPGRLQVEARIASPEHLPDGLSEEGHLSVGTEFGIVAGRRLADQVACWHAGQTRRQKRRQCGRDGQGRRCREPAVDRRPASLPADRGCRQHPGSEDRRRRVEQRPGRRHHGRPSDPPPEHEVQGEQDDRLRERPGMSAAEPLRAPGQEKERTTEPRRRDPLRVLANDPKHEECREWGQHHGPPCPEADRIHHVAGHPVEPLYADRHVRRTDQRVREWIREQLRILEAPHPVLEQERIALIDMCREEDLALRVHGRKRSRDDERHPLDQGRSVPRHPSHFIKTALQQHWTWPTAAPARAPETAFHPTLDSTSGAMRMRAFA
jgi:hypothetical protein